jgi:hypothetical protein
MRYCDGWNTRIRSQRNKMFVNKNSRLGGETQTAEGWRAELYPRFLGGLFSVGFLGGVADPVIGDRISNSDHGVDTLHAVEPYPYAALGTRVLDQVDAHNMHFLASGLQGHEGFHFVEGLSRGDLSKAVVSEAEHSGQSALICSELGSSESTSAATTDAEERGAKDLRSFDNLGGGLVINGVLDHVFHGLAKPSGFDLAFGLFPRIATQCLFLGDGGHVFIVGGGSNCFLVKKSHNKSPVKTVGFGVLGAPCIVVYYTLRHVASILCKIMLYIYCKVWYTTYNGKKPYIATNGGY